MRGPRYSRMLLESGQVIIAHHHMDCVGEFCSVHNPSPHPMVAWPRYWNGARNRMERVCSHGHNHPDPDDLAHKALYLGTQLTDVAAVHTCDHCCIEEKDKTLTPLNPLAPPASLIMTKGLPGSGKSTWAKETVRNARRGAVMRVNKDDLRAMLHDDRFGGATEKRTVDARDALVRTFLAQGKTVIVDDTNLNPVHEERLRELAAEVDATFEIKDFCHVPIETCIKQDLMRAKSVGEQVIRGEFRKWFAQTTAPARPYDPELPNVVLVDIDGTLARMRDRGPFEWHRVGEDAPIGHVIYLVNALHMRGVEVIFLSGRDSVCRKATRQWLRERVGEWTSTSRLYMRPEGDMRKDAIVKEEIFWQRIAGKFNVWFVLDDRDQVVHMWRSTLGIPCYQVAPGAF